MVFFHTVFFVCALYSCGALQAAHNDVLMHTAVITPDSDAGLQHIDQWGLQPSVLKKVTFDCDVCFSRQEFEYLFGVKEGELLSCQSLKKALWYMRRKNKFKTISVTLKHHHDGVAIHISCSSFWTFGRLKIDGITVGKDRFVHYYLMEPGEQFDQEKHVRSVQAIKKALEDDGYHAAEVTQTVYKDMATKSVSITLHVVRGTHFAIGDLKCDVRMSSPDCERDSDAVRAGLQRKFFKKIPKKGYTRIMLNTLMRDVKRYLFHRGFLNVTISLKEKVNKKEGMIDLTFRLDLSQKTSFVFVGNHFFSSNQLLDSVVVFGRSVCLLPAAIVQQEIEQLYKDNGFWDIVVSSKQEGSRYFFLIKEGKRAKINKVVLRGVDSFLGYRRTGSYFRAIKKHRYVDRALEKKVLNDFIKAYRDHGFLDAVVVKKTYEPADRSGEYTFVVDVDTGNQVQITSVAVSGYPKLDSAELPPLFQIKEGMRPLHASTLFKQRAWLVYFLKQQGEEGVTVEARTQREGDTVSIVWEISLQKITNRFGKMVLVGSSPLPFPLFIRELECCDGALWDKKKLHKTFEHFKKLDIFETISLHPDYVDGCPDEQALVAQVPLDDPFELRLRAGFGLQQFSREFAFAGVTYRLGGSFFIKNPFNKADLASLDVDIARAYRSFAAVYQRAWLFGRRIHTSFKGYHNVYHHPGIVGSEKNLYKVKQQGFLVDMIKQYEWCDVSLNVGVEWMETVLQKKDYLVNSFVNSLARTINFAPQLLDRNIPYFLFEPTVIINYVDDKLQPRKGLFTLIGLKGMIPLWSSSIKATFARFLFEQSCFVPLGPAVLALRVRFGHIFHQLFSTIMPTERFYLGGAHSIRSYEIDMCPPLGEFIDCYGKRRFVPRGGKSMIASSLELRLPLYKEIGVVLFQDVGALSSDRFADITRDKVLSATGFGLRYNTPLGPLRFDIGWKLHTPDPCASRYAWFLALGNAF